MTEQVRVVVADDQALVRAGFRMILAADGIDVVGEAADGAQAVDTVRRTRPDVVLMDIRMPELDGLEATRRILSGAEAGPRVIMLTTFDLDRYVYAALSAGASGFLLKDVSPEHLVAAVRLVRSGDALLAPTITRRLIERFASRDERAAALHRDLAALTRASWRSSSFWPGGQQRRNRGQIPVERGDREDARGADPGEAAPARPRPGGCGGVRDRSGGAGFGGPREVTAGRAR